MLLWYGIVVSQYFLTILKYYLAPITWLTYGILFNEDRIINETNIVSINNNIFIDTKLIGSL